MKNKIRFEDLTHFIFLFLMFLSFTTIFLSMKNNEVDEMGTEFCGVVETEGKVEFTPEVLVGKKLFKTNCGSCHASDMTTDLTGPALGDVTSRWSGKEEELIDWVRNAPKYLSENPNHSYAVALSKKYPSAMTPFPDLRDEEIENILTYIESIYNR